MPRPQAPTPAEAVLADVDTCIRLGIEGHSLRTSRAHVKYRCGDADLARAGEAG